MSNELSRRALIVEGLALLGLTAVGVRELWHAAQAGETAPGGPSALRAFLDAYADTLIPDTDTLGAKSVGASKFVELLVNHAPDQATVAAYREKLGLIRAALDERAGSSFERLDAARRAKVLDAFDRDVLTGASGQEYSAAYGQLKSLTLHGYYTSQAGATQELRYELVPGRFDPDIAFDPNARAYSNLD